MALVNGHLAKKKKHDKELFSPSYDMNVNMKVSVHFIVTCTEAHTSCLLICVTNFSKAIELIENSFELVLESAY